MTDQTAVTDIVEVDARGLICPVPVLRMKKALAKLQSGHMVKVYVTDPDAPRDFKAFAQQTGHQIVEVLARDKEWTVLIRRR